MERTYITSIDGTGTTNDPFKPCWRNTLTTLPKVISQSIDAHKYKLWSGIMDTDTAEHNLLTADNRIAYIPRSIMRKTVSELTTAQYNKLLFLLNIVKIPPNIFNPNKVLVGQVLMMIQGKICFRPLAQAADEMGE